MEQAIQTETYSFGEGVMSYRDENGETITTPMEEGRTYYSANPVEQNKIEKEIERNAVLSWIHPFRLSHKIAHIVTPDSFPQSFEFFVLLAIGFVAGFVLKRINIKYYYILASQVGFLYFDPKPFGYGGRIADSARNIFIIAGMWIGFFIALFF